MAREAFFLYKLLFKHVTSYQKKPEKFKTWKVFPVIIYAIGVVIFIFFISKFCDQCSSWRFLLNLKTFKSIFANNRILKAT